MAEAQPPTKSDDERKRLPSDDSCSAYVKLSDKKHDNCEHCRDSLFSYFKESSQADDKSVTKTIVSETPESSTGSDNPVIPRSLSIKGRPKLPSSSHAFVPEGVKPTIIVLVGLPARGKTYISKKLTRYLNWVGVPTKVFNVGDYRRRHTAAAVHEFFSPSNSEAIRLRELCSRRALEDATAYLTAEAGQVAVLDATNSTRRRRQGILAHCAESNFSAFFVESYCDSDAIVEANILDVKVNNPDYHDCRDKEAAANDFRQRIRLYETDYQPLEVASDGQLSFIKIINQGERFLINRLRGNIQSRVAYYLMNVKVAPGRCIYLVRHGESMFNMIGRIGGDADLSERGRAFAKRLAAWVDERNTPGRPPLRVWTSHMRRTIQTAAFIRSPHTLEHWKALDEIDAGVCEGLTYEEIAERYPIEFANRDKDKFNYRYPGGESYSDLVTRLEPVIMELDRQSHVLVVCHQAVARCLLGYYMDKKHGDLPYIRVPLHTLVRLTPVAYGCIVEHISLDVPCVDTHRERPENTEPDRTPGEALATIPDHY